MIPLWNRERRAFSIPDCTAIYVSAGTTAPLQSWLDALRPTGRLLFPLTPDGTGDMPGLGGMLLITRVTEERFDARFYLTGDVYPLR